MRPCPTLQTPFLYLLALKKLGQPIAGLHHPQLADFMGLGTVAVGQSHEQTMPAIPIGIIPWLGVVGGKDLLADLGRINLVLANS